MNYEAQKRTLLNYIEKIDADGIRAKLEAAQRWIDKIESRTDFTVDEALNSNCVISCWYVLCRRFSSMSIIIDSITSAINDD